jgi:hypothetical protein
VAHIHGRLVQHTPTESDPLVPLTVPGDAERPDVPDGGEAVAALDSSIGRPAIGALDGGVARRLVRRCRTAAAILLVTGAVLLLVVAFAPWGVISALLALGAGMVLAGSLLLLRRAALWSAAGSSSLPPAAWPTAAGAPPMLEPTRPTSEQARPAPVDAADAPPVPGGPALPGLAATIGPTRRLSPGAAGTPVKRRLNSAVVPIYTDDGPAPGDGALVIHARADGAVLSEGDTVLVWLAGKKGLTALPVTASAGPNAAPVRGRFVLYRQSDGEIFLATTRLTDTW